MSALSDQASSTSCTHEDEGDVDLIQDTIKADDNSTQNNKEDNEDVDVIQEDSEDTEDSGPVKMRMRTPSSLGVAVKSIRRKSTEIKKEFCAEKKRDFQNIPRQDTTIDFRKGIDREINNSLPYIYDCG